MDNFERYIFCKMLLNNPCMFKEKLDELFNNAIDIHDTVWFTPSETLRDAIMRIYDEVHD